MYGSAKESDNFQKIMYLLAVIYIEEIFQLLTLKLDVRQNATRKYHKNNSSVISKTQIPELLLIQKCNRKYKKNSAVVAEERENICQSHLNRQLGI